MSTTVTTKELTAIEDQLSCEANLVKKYRAYSQQTMDPVLKNKYMTIADKHQTHFNTLMSHLS